jgi:hypothetical protein
MDWSGLLLPLFEKWFPWMSPAVAVVVIGFIISILTQVFKPKAPPETIAEQKAGTAEPRPLIVAVPAAAGFALAGPWGLLAPALGHGLLLAATTIAKWVGSKVGSK